MGEENEETCQQLREKAFDWLESLMKKADQVIDKDKEEYGKNLKPWQCYYWDQISESKKGSIAFDPFEIYELTINMVDEFFKGFAYKVTKEHFFVHFMMKLGYIIKKYKIDVPMKDIQHFLEGIKNEN